MYIQLALEMENLKMFLHYLYSHKKLKNVVHLEQFHNINYYIDYRL